MIVELAPTRARASLTPPSRTRAVLAATLLLACTLPMRAHAQGVDVAEDRVHTATVSFQPGNAQASGFSSATVPVDYRFFYCSTGGGVLVTFTMRESGIQTSSMYWHQGQSATVRGAKPDPTWHIIEMTVLYGGQPIRSQSIVVSPKAEMNTDCDRVLGDNAHALVVDLKDRGIDGRNEQAVRAFMGMLTMRLRDIPSTLRSNEADERVSDAAQQKRQRADAEAAKRAADVAAKSSASTSASRTARATEATSSSTASSTSSRTRQTSGERQSSRRDSDSRVAARSDAGQSREDRAVAARDKAQRDSVEIQAALDAQRAQEERDRAVAQATAQAVVAGASVIADVAGAIASDLHDHYEGFSLGVGYLVSPFPGDKGVASVSMGINERELLPFMFYTDFGLGLGGPETQGGGTTDLSAAVGGTIPRLGFHVSDDVPLLGGRWEPHIGYRYVAATEYAVLAPCDQFTTICSQKKYENVNMNLAAVGLMVSSKTGFLRFDTLLLGPKTMYATAIGMTF